MDEQTWHSCQDPRALLDRAEQLGKLGPRKSLLFICACSRRCAELLHEVTKEFVQFAEQKADEGIDEDWSVLSSVVTELAYQSSSPPSHMRINLHIRRAFAATSAGTNADFYHGAREILGLGAVPTAADSLPRVMRRFLPTMPTRLEQSLQEQTVILRDIFGSPFAALPPIDDAILRWNTGTVVALAQAAYELRSMPDGTLDATRLAILADSCEDAGIVDEQILGHLRGPGKHWRGCHVLDWLLRKESP